MTDSAASAESSRDSSPAPPQQTVPYDEEDAAARLILGHGWASYLFRMSIIFAFLAAFLAAYMDKGPDDQFERSFEHDMSHLAPEPSMNPSEPTELRSVSELVRSLLPHSTPFGRAFGHGSWDRPSSEDSLYVGKMLGDLPLLEDDDEYVVKISKDKVREIRRTVHKARREQWDMFVDHQKGRRCASRFGWLGSTWRRFSRRWGVRRLFGRHKHQHGFRSDVCVEGRGPRHHHNHRHRHHHSHPHSQPHPHPHTRHHHEPGSTHPHQ